MNEKSLDKDEKLNEDTKEVVFRDEKILDKIYTGFAITAPTILTLVVLYEILARPFGIVNIWTEELSRWIFVWICFLGAAYYVRKKDHIIVDIISQFKSFKKIERSLGFFLRLLMLAFFVLLAYGGIIYSINYGDRLASGMRIPERALYLSGPVAFVMMSIFEFLNLAAIVVKRFRKGEKI